MPKDVIIACDFDSAEKTMEFLELFQEERPFVKIGMELFYSQGPEIVRTIKARGHKIFLDVKVHDVPNTVRKTMAVLAGLDIDMVNVHAAGGSEMMAAAKEGLESGRGSKRPILIAVTQLTSTGPETLKNELLIEKDMEEVVKGYGLNAKKAGLDGVVCSALEAEGIHKVCGEDFVTVTPGIRFADSEKGDQKRVMTPEEARKVGSDYIVVGRPITQAENPVEAYRRCVKEFIG